MKKLFLLLLTAVMTVCAQAQTRTVSGTVYDADTDEPLMGATVMSVGADRGTATDAAGQFTLVIPDKVTKLRISYVGMGTQEVKAETPVNVRLTSANTLSEVIAVAYGTVKKAEYTGSASVVSADALEKTLVTDATQALTGKVAGVTTVSSNGAPGQAPSVLIRGVGSINASTSPLYVVDGLPYNGDISAIAPSDIDQMTVLKDAASTALYGARGANGVILITTKRGAEGKTRMTFNANWGGNSRMLPNYDVITDQPTYMQTIYNIQRSTGLYNLGYSEAKAHQYGLANMWKSLGYQTWSVPEGQDFIGTNGMWNPNATPGWSDGKNYFIADDWTKESFINGLRQDYTFAVQGGNNRFNYYLSANYLANEGVIKGSHFQRLNTRATVDYQAYDWLKLTSDINYTYTNKGYPGDNDLDASTSLGNSFFLAYGMGPIYPMYLRGANGKVLYNETYNLPIYDYGYGSQTPYSRNFMAMANPTGQLLYNKSDYLTDQFDGRWSASVTPITNLNVTGTVGYFLQHQREHYLANNLYGQSADYGGEAGQVSYRFRTISAQVVANYGIDFLDVNRVDVMLGYESQNSYSESLSANGSELYNPGSWVIDNTSATKNPYGSTYAFSTTGYFGRLKYALMNRYFLAASIRRDGSSRFHKDHRWGTFFSVSTAWDISKEKFMQQFENLDVLKFKVSFGQNGNDRMGSNFYDYYAYADFYKIAGTDGVWSDGTLYHKGNKDITWEKSNNFNIGFDFSFWQGKLSGTAEYYSRKVDNMLFFLPTAPSLGYSSYPANVGSMRNNGGEIELNYRPFNTKDFMLEFNANITIPNNKVLKLDPSIINEEFGGWVRYSTQLVEEGKPLYQMWLVEYAGVNDQGVSQYRAKATEKYVNDWNKAYNEGDKAEPCPYKVGEEFLTTAWNTARDTNRKQSGNTMPKIYGGFGMNARLYGFDFAISFAYQAGGKVYDNGYSTFMYNGNSGGQFLGQNIHKDMLNAWTPQNTNTNIPRLSTVDQYPLYTSDFFMVSSNYLSLNNINVGYTIPKNITRKFMLENLRVYFAAENVALWSKRKGLDPRQDFRTSDNATYSPMRTISGGIQLSF